MTRSCADPRCPEFATHGSRCETHHKENERSMSSRGGHDPRYRSPRWRRMKSIVRNEEAFCASCSINPTADVDHIVPPADGGAFWARTNLQGLCKRCHGKKTAKEVRGRTFK